MSLIPWYNTAVLSPGTLHSVSPKILCVPCFLTYFRCFISTLCIPWNTICPLFPDILQLFYPLEHYTLYPVNYYVSLISWHTSGVLSPHCIPWNTICPLFPDILQVFYPYTLYPLEYYMSLIPWHTTVFSPSTLYSVSPKILYVPYSLTYYRFLTPWCTPDPLSPDILHGP